MRRTIYASMLAAMAVLLFAFPVMLWAQEPDVPAASTNWYTTVGGIVVATGTVVAILKRLLAKVSGLNQIPIWVYGVTISSGLTYLANQRWHTLPGDLWELMMQAVGMAALATGFYEWLNSDDGGVAKSLMKPLAASTVSADIIRKG